VQWAGLEAAGARVETLRSLQTDALLLLRLRLLRPVLLTAATHPPTPYDPSSLAFASLTFNRDNRFDARIYSIGVAMFPISFCLFQVGVASSGCVSAGRCASC